MEGCNNRQIIGTNFVGCISIGANAICADNDGIDIFGLPKEQKMT
jgi:hypothetical protein